MSAEPKKKRHDIVGDMLGRVQLYDRGIMLATGLIGLAGFAVAYVTLAAHTDRLAAWAGGGGGLSVFARLAIMAALISSLALGVTLFLIFFFRRTRTLAMARRIELEHPEFKHSLVTYMEICRRGTSSSNERAVARAVGKRAAKRLAHVEPSEMANADLLIRIAAAAIACCLVAFISALVSWNTFSVSLARIVWPSSKRRPATSTQIGPEIVPGDVKVLRQSGVRFEAEISGTLPDKAWLVYEDEDGGHEEFARRPKDPGPWTWLRQSVENDFEYYIKAGDARSETHRVDVVEVPVITDVTVRYECPKYMGMGPRTERGGQISTYEGTTVTVTAKTNKPADSAGAEPVARDVLWYKDTDGFRNPEPVKYSIVAMPDEAPSVRIVEPGENIELAAGDVLLLVVRAEDEFGLTSLKVVYELRGMPREIELPRPRRKKVIERLALSMRSIGARPGDRIRYWAVARDNMPGTPNVGKSQDYFVTIKMPEEEGEDEIALLDEKEIAEIAGKEDPFEALKKQLEAPPKEDVEGAAAPEPGEGDDPLAKLADERDKLAGEIKAAIENAAKADEMDPQGRDELADKIEELADELERAAQDAEQEIAMVDRKPAADEQEGGHG